MGELLKKPYEISVWEERLAQDGSRLIETKLAVIGSDTMTGLNKIYEPIFTKKVNGEKTLTFSLKYKYFDPSSGADNVINPFAALLTNERKVKLYYDNKWYEFVIKDHTESSDGLIWTYSCNDAFVLELSKTGYNITFDTELNNNQGTARELAQQTIKDTSWRLGDINTGKQLVEEPVYKGVLESKTGITIINATDGGLVNLEAGLSIYVFYTYVKNQNGKFVQFIIYDENREYTIDDKKVITDTNYRILEELTYNNNGFYFNDTLIISLGEIENRYHVNRLVYSQLNTYDPIMERTVDRFKINNLEVYKYTDYEYTTSNVVTNLITNGDNFNILEDGTLQGWNPYVESSGTIQKLELVTKPELGTGKALIDVTKESQIEGFLKVHFNGALNNNYQNAIYNSGFSNNISLIESISKGQKFVFRWRAGSGDINNLTAAANLGLIVAKYSQDEPTWGYYYKHIDPNNIILKIQGTPQIYNNKITGGTVNAFNQSYIIDGVPQTPSSRYIYVDNDDNKLYRWNPDTQTFEQTQEDSGLPYYFLVGEAQKSISNATLTSSSEHIGIFIYTTGFAGDYFIQDIQLTKYFENEDNKPIVLGNIPTATSTATDYYYFKPEGKITVAEINLYNSPEEIESIVEGDSKLYPLYNEDSEKYLTISESHSNCFNILQTIAETFECWIDLVVNHDDNGAISIDESGKPEKYIYIREYVGQDNYVGFKYGINLNSIERTINSEEIVTKLIVDDSQSDLVDTGYISIADAPSNPSRESYILNFSYYYNQGLLDRNETEQDKNDFTERVQELNAQLKEKENNRNNLSNSYTVLQSRRNVYNELLQAAREAKNKALEDFEAATNESYENYQQTHTTLEVDKQLTEEENVLKILGVLYNSSSVINNYAGLATNIEGEYTKIKNKLDIVEDEIQDLLEQKDETVKTFMNKYGRFIQEGTWNSTDYIDSELYYLDALQVSQISAQPVITYSINVVEVSQLENLEAYLFDVGDKTYIEDTEFFGWHVDNIGNDVNPNYVYTPAREEVIVSEVEWHLDEPENNIITVQNYKTRFEDLFQRISATVQTVQYNEATYAKISTLMDADGTINQNVLINALNNIAGKEYNLTSDGSILIHGDEILIRNLNNRENCVILNNEGIKVSSDGGQNWATAIDGYGINAGAIYTDMLNTAQVVIGSKDNPSFRWDKSGISAYRFLKDTQQTRNLLGATAEEEQVYDLQTFVRFDQYGLYGIKNNGTFKASSLQDVKEKAHFAVTWDGFFIKNDYTGGGRVEITSTNDFRVLKTVNNEEKEVIKIGALEWGNSKIPISGIAPTLYGIRITNDDGIETFKTGNDGNITITGTINATGGNFSGIVNVGPENQNHIIIDGRNINNSPSIASSNYQDGAGYGWMINKNGDAVFNNITARGAIKTAVFEYAEIQAVGGIFIFRPSSTIRNAARVGETDDITITVEKQYLFKVGDWCKISNYTDSTAEPNASAILANNGLTHVYRIKSIDSTNSRILVLENAYAALTSGDTKVINDITDLIGGALVDMGDKANGDGKTGNNNYGIGVNSSDNTVNLPRRAISLFETVIDETKNPKVSYRYRGILGTLPVLQYGKDQQVHTLYHDYMESQQGIYTDNIYIGDSSQYLAFYTDNEGNKHLKISAKEMIMGYDPDGNEITWEEHIDEQIPIRVEIESMSGNLFYARNINTQLVCTVYKGNIDITDQVINFTWQKKDKNGNIDKDWTPPLGTGRRLEITNADVDSKAIFTCIVQF